MDNLTPQGTNWVIIILIFTASFSLAGFTSRWLARKIPSLGKYGFFLFLASTTCYFSIITLLMRDVLQR